VDDLLGFVALVAGLAATLAGLVWLGVRVRRRGVGGDVMGPFEEIWRPTAHRSRLEIQVREERVVPRPPPDDKWRY
jgi:hypothetical protein